MMNLHKFVTCIKMSLHGISYCTCTCSALELQPDDWLTMYYNGEVLGRQRKMEDAKDMFKLAAETEIMTRY